MTESKMIPIEPVSKDLLYMKVADSIQSFIHKNNLQPGDKIPPERVMAAQLQTSRNSVREALRVLENEGIIEVKIGKGAFITASPGQDSIYFRLFKVNYLELMQTKTLLEREAIRNAIRTGTPEQFTKLEAELLLLEEAARHGFFSQEQDKCFHYGILAMAENKTMAQMVRNLIDVLNDYAKQLDTVEPLWLKTIPFHRSLFEAMRARDFALAVKAHEEILAIDSRALNTLA